PCGIGRLHRHGSPATIGRMSIDVQDTVRRLRAMQAEVRQMVIDSRNHGDLHEVSRSTEADTIYKIDELIEPILVRHCEEWGKVVPIIVIAEGMEDEN